MTEKPRSEGKAALSGWLVIDSKGKAYMEATEEGAPKHVFDVLRDNCTLVSADFFDAPKFYRIDFVVDLPEPSE